MNLQINQVININVHSNEQEFLFVKRDLGFKVRSKYYQNNNLICESTLITYFLKQNVEIEYQNMSNQILLYRNNGWCYSLFSNNIEYALKIKIFKKPSFRLFANGQQIGTIGNPNNITLEGRNYEMKTDTNDEEVNLNLLILFISQLRAF